MNRLLPALTAGWLQDLFGVL